MTGDQDVITADGTPLSFQGRSDLGGVVGRRGVKSQHLELGRETFDFAPIVVRPRRLRRAVEKLGQDHCGDAECFGVGVKAFA